jgi:enoyl-CoA hydratase/carnithine racemase
MGSGTAVVTVALETRAAIATVTLDRPAKRNALSLAVMRELRGVLEGVGRDRSVRAVILRAHGPAFSAGHDLRELLARSAAEYDEIFSECIALMDAIQHLPQPVIAEVAGIATAAGCQLVATCDLAIAAEEATFATPGVKIGLFCTTPMVALTRAIGRKRALEMLLTGEPIDARTAADWGLINRVVPASELAATARSLAERIAGAAAPTVALGKAAFYRQIDADQASAYALSKEVMCANAQAVDAQEGMNAFIERRSPHWSQPEPEGHVKLT